MWMDVDVDVDVGRWERLDGERAELGVLMFPMKRGFADDDMGCYCRDKRPSASFSNWIDWWLRVGRRYVMH